MSQPEHSEGTVNILKHRFHQMAKALGEPQKDASDEPLTRRDLEQYLIEWCYGENRPESLGVVSRNFPYISYEAQYRLATSTVAVLGEHALTTATELTRFGVGNQRIHYPGISPSDADDIFKITPIAGGVVQKNLSEDEQRRAFLLGREHDKRPERQKRASLVIDTSPFGETSKEIALQAVEKGIPYVAIINYGFGVTSYYLGKGSSSADVEQLFEATKGYTDLKKHISTLLPIGDALTRAIAMTYATRIITPEDELKKCMIDGELISVPKFVDINLLDLVFEDGVKNKQFLEAWKKLQKEISQHRILIAGLGAGSSAAHILALLGFPLKVTDPAKYGRENLSRQHMSLSHVGISKTKAFAEQHPSCDIQTDEKGVQPSNISTLAQGCNIAIDMIDIGLPGLTLQFHRTLRLLGISVVTGFDAGWSPIVDIYGSTYTMESLLGFDDRTKPEQLNDRDPIDVIMQQMGRDIPPEIHLAVNAFRSGEVQYGPQLGATGLAVGAIEAILVIGRLMYLPVRNRTTFNLMDAIQKNRTP